MKQIVKSDFFQTKKIVSPILGILMLALSGCTNDKGDDIESHIDIPAIVAYNWEINQPVLITDEEVFLAPDLMYYFYYGYLLEEDAIFANFLLNHSRQSSKDFRTISYFESTMLLDKVKPTIEEEEDYDANNYEFIEAVSFAPIIIYDRIHVLFAAFYQSSYHRVFDYEMIYDADNTYSTPALSFRAKKKGTPTGTKQSFWWPGAFDMYDYLTTLEKDDENKVYLNFRFQSRDDDGNEVWKEWEGNPYVITLKGNL